MQRRPGEGEKSIKRRKKTLLIIMTVPDRIIPLKQVPRGKVKNTK
jgi:hypothetical protein